MDALKDELVGIFAQVQDSLHAHNPFTELGEQFAKPLADLDAIKVARDFDGNGFDIFSMGMMMIVFFRFDFQIESPQIEYHADVDVGVSGLTDARGTVQVA